MTGSPIRPPGWASLSPISPPGTASPGPPASSPTSAGSLKANTPTRPRFCWKDRAVDQGIAAGQAGRAGEPCRPEGGDRAPLGHHRPDRHPQGGRVRHRLHRRLHSVATREAVPKAVLRRRLLLVLFRAGHEHGHQAGRGHRQARRERGRPAPGTAPVRQRPRRSASVSQSDSNSLRKLVDIDGATLGSMRTLGPTPL